MRELRYYVTPGGRSPAEDWLDELRDVRGAALIRARLDRLSYGNAGDHSSVGEGVWELRIHFGPGYRVYYGYEEGNIILLLCGGDKGTQGKDIKRAQAYLQNYRRIKE